jgi:hypothetical protein
MSLKLGVFRDLVDDAVCDLVIQMAVLVARGLDGEGVRVGAGGMHAGRCHGGVANGGDLHVQCRAAAGGVARRPSFTCVTESS